MCDPEAVSGCSTRKEPMLLYLDSNQAKTLIDILEGVIFREEMIDYADFQENESGQIVRIERPDLVALSKQKVQLSSDLIDKLKAML